MATTLPPAIIVTDLSSLPAIIDQAMEVADAFPSGLTFANAVEEAIEVRATQLGRRLAHPDRVRIGCEAVLAWNHHQQQRTRGAA